MNPYHIAYISVGSNLGNKLENCRSGIAALIRSGNTRLVDQSPIYRTEPVDYLNQEWFVNCVAKIETDLDPLPLLDILKSIERAAGRIKDTIRFGPRVLDLDIILFDDLVLNEPGLTVPHPRMHKRRFVLKPICDIEPDINHPVFHRTMKSLLEDLDEKGQRLVEYR
ncbi:MAG: 2-amino-4-hydroxy-6-hydroxymethyldihydropteridine diphosphokinase [Desulfobacterales bacterium]|nr:MAG: 2-amino-4-hydroxy-6-hydroxymethyldihydropteridine diphosphokinase [Desulfobacterales bacterium]